MEHVNIPTESYRRKGSVNKLCMDFQGSNQGEVGYWNVKWSKDLQG